MRSFFLRHKKNESGQSLVEFALVLPVLALLILGIVDFGMAFHGVVTVNTAAREGARQGVVLENNEGTTNSKTVVQAARRVTATLPGEEDRLNIWINNVEAYVAGEGEKSPFDLPVSGSDMTVKVTYDYDLITPLPAFTGITSPLTLRGQITMMRE